MCSLSSHTSLPLNSVNAQYTKYKDLNHSNDGQHNFMYLIQTQQQVLGPSAGAY